MRLYETPERIRPEQDLAAAAMKAAAAMERWELVELAVDWLLAQQQVFVRWWADTVRSAGRQPNNLVLGYLSTAEAHAQTGIKQQTVSRWRGYLAADQIDDYRQRIIDKARDILSGKNPDALSPKTL